MAKRFRKHLRWILLVFCTLAGLSLLLLQQSWAGGPASLWMLGGYPFATYRPTTESLLHGPLRDPSGNPVDGRHVWSASSPTGTRRMSTLDASRIPANPFVYYRAPKTIGESIGLQRIEDGMVMHFYGAPLPDPFEQSAVKLPLGFGWGCCCEQATGRVLRVDRWFRFRADVLGGLFLIYPMVVLIGWIRRERRRYRDARITFARRVRLTLIALCCVLASGNLVIRGVGGFSDLVPDRVFDGNFVLRSVASSLCLRCFLPLERANLPARTYEFRGVVAHRMPYTNAGGRSGQYWTVLIDPLWLVGLFLLYPAGELGLWWLRRRRTKPTGCRGCGYDLTGNESGICPECGEAVT
jgi:hypothetical protein